MTVDGINVIGWISSNACYFSLRPWGKSLKAVTGVGGPYNMQVLCNTRELMRVCICAKTNCPASPRRAACNSPPPLLLHPAAHCTLSECGNSTPGLRVVKKPVDAQTKLCSNEGWGNSYGECQEVWYTGRKRRSSCLEPVCYAEVEYFYLDNTTFYWAPSHQCGSTAYNFDDEFTDAACKRAPSKLQWVAYIACLWPARPARGLHCVLAVTCSMQFWPCHRSSVIAKTMWFVRHACRAGRLL